jgi:VanZ family protein
MKLEPKTKKSQLVFYIKAYLPSLLWATVIFLLSNQQQLPSFNLSLLDFLFKKLAHIFVYAVLYYLLFLAYLKTNPSQLIEKKYYLWPLLISLVYSLSDELHQSLIKGRHANIRDIAYDFLGMMSVLLHQQKML